MSSMGEAKLGRLVLKQANFYRLQKRVEEYIAGTRNGPRFTLTEDVIRDLHRVAMQGLLPNPGEYRSHPVQLSNSNHCPPPHADVRNLMGQLVWHVDAAWDHCDLVRLAAIVMWRLNWIHPFPNGNGRTARAAAYLVMCARHGNLLPPRHTIIEQIMADRRPYYAALSACDNQFSASGNIGNCCGPLEAVLSQMLIQQLAANGL